MTCAASNRKYCNAETLSHKICKAEAGKTCDKSPFADKMAAAKDSQGAGGPSLLV